MWLGEDWVLGALRIAWLWAHRSSEIRHMDEIIIRSLIGVRSGRGRGSGIPVTGINTRVVVVDGGGGIVTEVDNYVKLKLLLN